MRKKPKCHLCGAKVRGNVDGTKRIECGMCVQRRVKFVENLEWKMDTKIKNGVEYSVAYKAVLLGQGRGKGKQEKVPQKGLECVKTVLWAENFKSVDRSVTPVKWDDRT